MSPGVSAQGSGPELTARPSRPPYTGALRRPFRRAAPKCDGRQEEHSHGADRGWANRREGGKRASSTHDTKAGRAAAKKDGVEHLIHKKDGTIGDRNSYGNDPPPPKG